MAEIKTVTADDLRQMEDQEGLVLQGCGGDLQEWVDGINDLFTEAGILQSGSRDVYKRQDQKSEDAKSGLATLPNPISPIDTRKELADTVGLGERTMRCV